jgi:hypothetical protein
VHRLNYLGNSVWGCVAQASTLKLDLTLCNYLDNGFCEEEFTNLGNKIRKGITVEVQKLISRS